MSGKEFDPRKFIDRDFEQEIFEELLKRKDQARILTIKDAGGMGKSHLLQHFRYRCRIVKPRIPVSLIALDQLGDDSPLTLVQKIAGDLAAFAVKFPEFEKFEIARSAYDFTTIRGRVDLSHANLSQAQRVDVGGVITKADTIQQVNIGAGVPAFTPDQQAKAQQVSVQAFLDDLKQCCDRQLVVIMLDAFERCEPTLQQWLIDHLLGRHCFDFDRRPAHFMLVIAGRELPDFDLYWSIEDCDAVIKSVKSLSRWTAGHVEKCLRVHGFNYTQQQLKTFIQMIEIGLPPSQVMQGMQALLTTRSG